MRGKIATPGNALLKSSLKLHVVQLASSDTSAEGIAAANAF
jgi:hypothetical protein